MTSSVTGCSTCSRVFISRKQNSPCGVQDELDGARADVAERLARGDRGLATARRAGRRRRPATAHSSTIFWWRRWIEHSRSNRCDDGAVRVAEDLDLDVARVDRRSARGTRCRRRTPTPASRRPLATASASSSGRATSRMPRPPPPNAALTSTGKPIRRGRGDRGRSPRGRRSTPGQHRHAGRRHQRLGLELRAHGLDRLGRRPDEGEPGVGAAAGEGGVLGEEPVAGVHGVGAGAPRPRRRSQVAAQVGVGRRGAGQAHGLVGLAHERRVGVGVGEHGDGGDAQSRARCGMTRRGDLAAVGDQQLA